MSSPSPTKLATMKMVDSSVSGGIAAVSVGGYATGVVLLRCRVEDSLSGVHVSPGGVIRIQESRVSQCWNGVIVGHNADCVRAAVGDIQLARRDAVPCDDVGCDCVRVAVGRCRGTHAWLRHGERCDCETLCNRVCRAVIGIAQPVRRLHGWRFHAANVHDPPEPEAVPGIEVVPDDDSSL